MMISQSLILKAKKQVEISRMGIMRNGEANLYSTEVKLF